MTDNTSKPWQDLTPLEQQTAWAEHAAAAKAMSPGPKKSHTVRNVLLGITAGFFLLLAGCSALFVGAANEVAKEIDAAASADPDSGSSSTFLDDISSSIEDEKADAIKAVTGFYCPANAKDFDYGISSGGFEVTANHDQHGKTYLFTVTMTDSTGTVVGEGNVVTPELNPGQKSRDEITYTISQGAKGAITCEFTDASRY